MGTVKLSNKGRYAIRALFDIAFFNEGRPTQIRDISERQGIPSRFLEQIFQDLKRAGIVSAKRGPQGGYTLSKRPSEISLGEVIRGLEGPIALGEAKDAEARRKSPQDGIRVIESVLSDLSRKVEACFDETSIADVCERAEQQGMRASNEQRYVYVI